MAIGFNGLLDFVGYRVGLPGAPSAIGGFKGLLDFSGYAVGKGGAGFPIQYAGLRAYYGVAVRELCLVAEADAPAGMGGVIKINKGGTNYVIYLVETGDANATPIRVKTTTGVKAIRIKT